MFRLFSLILLSLFSALILIGCDQKTEEQTEVPEPRKVRTQVVESSSGNVWREFPGLVDAAKKADLSFREGGKLTELKVNEGENVVAGQLLATLDDTDFKIQLSSRQAEYNKVKKDFERAKQLVGRGVISQAEFNNFESQEAISKANLETARQNLLYTELKAPFDGTIARRHVENFEEVNAQQLVFTLQDLSFLTVKVDVPESVIIKANRDRERKLDVTAIFDTIPDKVFPLTIKEVATQPNESTSTFEVTFTMSETENYNLLPGMSVTARVRPPDRTQDANEAFILPSHAVSEDESGRFVWIAKPAGQGLGQIEKRQIESGTLTAQGIEITSGLNSGERVVIAGMSKMQEGLQVRLGEE